jgi:hypothetical protein
MHVFILSASVNKGPLAGLALSYHFFGAIWHCDRHI